MKTPLPLAPLAALALFALWGSAVSAPHGLEAIALLGFVGDHLPPEFPPLTPE